MDEQPLAPNPLSASPMEQEKRMREGVLTISQTIRHEGFERYQKRKAVNTVRRQRRIWHFSRPFSQWWEFHCMTSLPIPKRGSLSRFPWSSSFSIGSCKTDTRLTPSIFISPQ